jgi:beta-xylosidase
VPVPHNLAKRLRLRYLRLVAGAARPHTGGPPVDDRDFPDPYVLRVGSTYFAYATNAGGANVQVMRSADLARWEALPDALPELPSWAGPGRTWAPAVLHRGDRYVLYYTVREPTSDRQCISVATARTPAGPFTDTTPAPLVFQLERGGSIDPSPFVDHDGTAHLLWKSDDNAFERPTVLWGQPLSSDGLALSGAPTELLRHDRDWERPLIEAPAMVSVESVYYLFYSARWWESADYAIGYAISLAPVGPFLKVTNTRPWMMTGGPAAGPGGQELFTAADGALWIAYHAWTPGRIGYGVGGARSLRLSRLGFPGGRPRAGP